MNYSKPSLPMATWAEEDQPREKLILQGRNFLSDAELLAIILGSGSRNQSALSLAKEILQSTDHNLHELGKLSVPTLKRFKGIGTAKAVSIVAAFELGRRRQHSQPKTKPQITSSEAAYQLMKSKLEDLPHEEFWIILLNRANRVIQQKRVSTGGIAGTVVDPKIIFRHALEANASSLILCHNHPSGQLRPSQADLIVTKKLQQAGNFLEIQVLDHLIISCKGYKSLADEGQML